jgi:plastocyanin
MSCNRDTLVRTALAAGLWLSSGLALTTGAARAQETTDDTASASDVSPQPAAPAAAANVAAVVVDNRFQPTSLELGVGTSVTWTNAGSNLHTLSSLDGLFDSGALMSGQSFTYTFDKPGTYQLICRQHGLNGMTARVVVH